MLKLAQKGLPKGVFKSIRDELLIHESQFRCDEEDGAVYLESDPKWEENWQTQGVVDNDRGKNSADIEENDRCSDSDRPRIVLWTTWRKEDEFVDEEWFEDAGRAGVDEF